MFDGQISTSRGKIKLYSRIKFNLFQESNTCFDIFNEKMFESFCFNDFFFVLRFHFVQKE